jgi:phosphoglycolate phosphatase-like HAD superfamily hydrolase
MSQIKLVTMDLDGTLLNDKKQISEHTREVLSEAARRGFTLYRPQDGSLKPFLILSGILKESAMPSAAMGQPFMMPGKIRSYIRTIYRRRPC